MNIRRQAGKSGHLRIDFEKLCRTGFQKIIGVGFGHFFLDDFFPEQKLAAVLPQHLDPIVPDAEMSIAQFVGAPGNKGVEAVNGGIQEKPGRCRWTHIPGRAGNGQDHPAGFAGKKIFGSQVTDVVRGMSRGEYRPQRPGLKLVGGNQAVFSHGTDRTVPLGGGSQGFAGCLPQAGWIGYVVDARRVTDDGGLGESGGDLPNGSRMVKMNVGQQNIIEMPDV